MKRAELDKLVTNSIDEHYLRRAFTAFPSYWDGFVAAIDALSDLLSDRQLEDLLKNKLQLGLSLFDEKQYLQIACETTVNIYFARKFSSTFSYETKTTAKTKKDVDCSYGDNGYKYFIEVKCSDFKEKEKISAQDGIKFSTAGRIPNYDESFKDLSTMLEEGQKNLEGTVKPVLKQKNMDNNLKDFLISAHNKFNDDATDDEVNILVVCCGDPSDMQAWYLYMYSHEGLFTGDSFCERDKYKNVDMVVLTNLYHRHNKFIEKQHLKEHWLLEKSCNFIFSNPSRKSLKEPAMMHFINTFPHYTFDLSNYNVPGPAEQYVKDLRRIPYFVKEMLTDKGIVLF
jgi:hypothetical protein